jgi:hypothetical protein
MGCAEAEEVTSSKKRAAIRFALMAAIEGVTRSYEEKPNEKSG